MKIDGVFTIKHRGPVVTGEWDGDALAPGDTVRRVSDGSEWRVVGIERFVLYRDRPFTSTASRKVGLLVDREGLSVGDDLQKAEPPRSP